MQPPAEARGKCARRRHAAQPYCSRTDRLTRFRGGAYTPDGKEGTNEVNIGQDFYLGVYEVTQEEWQKVMGSNPSHMS